MNLELANPKPPYPTWLFHPPSRPDTSTRTKIHTGPLHPEMFHTIQSPYATGCNAPEVYQQTPAVFMASSIKTDEAWDWRDNVQQSIVEKGAYATSVYMQPNTYEKHHITKSTTSVGQGLATLLACDASLVFSHSGIYTLAEAVMTQQIGLPLFTDTIPEKWIISRQSLSHDTVTSLRQNKLTVLDHLLAQSAFLQNTFGVDIDQIIKQYDAAVLRELSLRTFWSYIEEYLRHPPCTDVTQQWMKARLRPLLGRNYELLRTITPQEKDSRRCMDQIDGKIQTINVVYPIWGTNGELIRFWHLPEASTHAILCVQTAPGSHEFITVPDAEWEG